jgi:hypothetical protein
MFQSFGWLETGRASEFAKSSPSASGSSSGVFLDVRLELGGHGFPSIDGVRPAKAVLDARAA